MGKIKKNKLWYGEDDYKKQMAHAFISICGGIIAVANTGENPIVLCTWGNEFLLTGQGSRFEVNLPIGETEVVLSFKSGDGLRRSKNISIATSGEHYIQIAEELVALQMPKEAGV